MTIGVDGCRSGWVAAIQYKGGIRIEVFDTLPALWNQYQAHCTLLLIDMPIGLIDAGPEGRECDRLARRMLSPRRHSSIFTPPCRPALYAPEDAASRVNFEQTGKKLSRQTINIMPKMREVDQWMRRLPVQDQQKVRESHPEVVFTALNEGVPLFHNKKTKEGQDERVTILERWQPGISDLLAQSKILRKIALKDDLIDALVLGIAADLVVRHPMIRHSLPESPPLDGEGLKMEILCPHYPSGSLYQSLIFPDTR